MRKVRFDKSLPTIPGGSRQVSVFSQEQLDDRIRTAARPHAVDRMVRETAEYQMYQLSDGRLLKVFKQTGECLVGDTTNAKRKPVQEFKHTDLILGRKKLPAQVEVTVRLSRNEIQVTIGGRDITWDRRTGEVTGTGFLIG